MTMQLELLNRCEHGERIAQRNQILCDLEAREGTRFMEKASTFILDYLRTHGPTSSETPQPASSHQWEIRALSDLFT